MTAQHCKHVPAKRHRFQFTLRTLLLVMILLSILLGFMRNVGPVELLLLAGLGGLAIFVAVCAGNRSSWILGVMLCGVIAMVVTPADPVSMLIVLVPLCCVYALALLAWRVLRKCRDT